MDKPPRDYTFFEKDWGRICQERLYWWGNDGRLPLRFSHLRNPDWQTGHVSRSMSILEDNGDRC